MTSETVATINELSVAWMPLLWRASWQGGVALLLILVSSLVVRNVPAHIQCWFWRLAFVKLLIAVPLIITVEFPWLPPVKSMTSVTPLMAFQSVTDAIPVRDDVASRSTPSQAAIPQLSRLSLLLLAWFVGAILFLANLLRHWAQVRKMTSSLESLTDKQLLNHVVEYCQEIGVSRQPQLRVSNNSLGPCLIGIFRPVIVLPSIILRPGSAIELSVALSHELAHIKRRDLFWNWLPALAEVMFFFHPLVWLAKPKWRLAQEIATDELAVSVSRVGLARYAESLVKLATKFPTASIRPHLALTASETFSQLSRRLIAMQTFQKPVARRRLTMAVVLFIIAVFGVVPWKLTPREVKAQAESAVALDEQEIPRQTLLKKSESPNRTITIRVIDCEGEPLKGVEIFRNHVYNLKDVERPEIENKAFWTDSEGKAVVTLSGTSIDLRLWAKEKNFIPLHAMWAKQFQSDGDQIPEEFTFQLERGTMIGGVVKNEKGEPIEGVQVDVQDQTAAYSVSVDKSKNSIRPVISQWLASGKDVLTDMHGRWELGNVPARHPFHPQPILLRLSHPDYVDDAEWGRLQSEQNITQKSLRNKAAVIVMKRDAESELDR